MPDPVHPLPPGKQPFLGTEYAMGTMLLRNSRPDGSGRYFATQWLLIVLPVVPLGRYYVRRGTITHGVTRTTTEYEVFGRSPLRAIEVIRTYLCFWLVIPTAFVGPIVASIAWYDNSSNEAPQLVAMLISIALLFLLIGLFGLYRTHWQPIREARWVTASPRRLHE